jgi:transketolase
VDYNQIQSFGRVKEVLDLEPLADKFRAFRWAVSEVDGHNMEQLVSIFSSLPLEAGRPTVVIAHTIKGKGVSFMEDQLAWHYKTPTADQLACALNELEAGA